MKPTALVCVPGHTAALTAALRHLGWDVVPPDTSTPLNLLLVTPAVMATRTDPATIERAMHAVADAIAAIIRYRQQLSAASGLVLILVGDSPRRSLTKHSAEGVVAAGLEMATQLLATDWAERGVRCHLVVTATDPNILAAFASWLAADPSHQFTGHTLDLAALHHATLRTTFS